MLDHCGCGIPFLVKCYLFLDFAVTTDKLKSIYNVLNAVGDFRSITLTLKDGA